MVAIDTRIKPELWQTIANSYLSENYTNVIKDAMSHLTETLRDKSGEDGDGYQLVGKALGGELPKIQVNKLQTETERNIQKGIEETLRGMYRFIRNPRSHEQMNDSKEDADAIVLFINYLLSYLGESTYYFTVDNFLQLVDDDYFVHDLEYVQGLVEKIPVRKRLDTLIEIYRNRKPKYIENVKAVISVLLKQLKNDDISNFMKVVSDEFQLIFSESEIITLVRILPIEHWSRIDKLARMRLENIMLKALNRGYVRPDTLSPSNVLLTWVPIVAPQFSEAGKLRLDAILSDLLNSPSFKAQNVIAIYFLEALPSIYPETNSQMKHIVAGIVNCLEQGNVIMKNALMEALRNYPLGWQKEFDEAIKRDFGVSNGLLISANGTIDINGFVEKDELRPIAEEDDIPF